jgi:hypothetical protein
MTEQEQKEYLMKLIEQQLTVVSDEAEGTQTVNMDLINSCSPDYIPMEEPALTKEQIMHMLHMDDPNIFPTQKKRDGKEKDDALHPTDNLGKKDDSEGEQTGGGTTYPGPESTITHSENLGEDIVYPEGTETDKVIDAIINDDSFGTVNAVIEFAQPAIRDPRGVDFKFLVKPGDTKKK